MSGDLREALGVLDRMRIIDNGLEDVDAPCDISFG